MRLLIPTTLIVLALAIPASAAEPAKAPDPKGLAFFESKIRPALVAHCYSCHAAEALKANKLRGGLLQKWRLSNLDDQLLWPGRSSVRRVRSAELRFLHLRSL